MGKPIAKKVIERAAHKEVKSGELVEINPDLIITMEVMWLEVRSVLTRLGAESPVNPEKIMLVPDHCSQESVAPPYWKSHKSMREYAEKYGVSYFEVGSGLRHEIQLEEGRVRPGMFIMNDEPNQANVGVIGALGWPGIYDVMEAMATGTNKMYVPRFAKARIEGKVGVGVLSRDITQYLVTDQAPLRLAGYIVEYEGTTPYSLSMDERQNLLGYTYKSGSNSAIMNPDSKAIEWIKERTNEPLNILSSDSDATYDLNLSYDVSELEPLICPPLSAEGFSDVVSKFEGKHVDAACIASCCGSRLDDLRAAAKVLAGRKIHKNVRMFVTPASRRIQIEAMKEGLLQTFLEAGAQILTPGCNTCWGYQGYLPSGDVMIATHTESYAGRNGEQDTQVYLANPYVVAASAVEGKIVDPRKYL